MNWAAVELIAGRVLLGGLFVFAGALKIVNPAPFIAHMTEFHVPSFLLPAVIALELVGGLMVWSGWRMTWAALALAFFCIATALIFHFDFGNKAERTLFIKDLAIAGGLFILAARSTLPTSA